jgi:hypothetical protein
MNRITTSNDATTRRDTPDRSQPTEGTVRPRPTAGIVSALSLRAQTAWVTSERANLDLAAAAQRSRRPSPSQSTQHQSP